MNTGYLLPIAAGPLWRLDSSSVGFRARYGYLKFTSGLRVRAGPVAGLEKISHMLC